MPASTRSRPWWTPCVHSGASSQRRVGRSRRHPAITVTIRDLTTVGESLRFPLWAEGWLTPSKRGTIVATTHDESLGVGAPGTQRAQHLPTGTRTGDGATIACRLRINRRSIQIALGIVWIVDAALQFQPKMFGSDFVSMVIAPNAARQPAAIASSITHMAHFLSRDVALWNTLFGLTQLAIGVGLLVRRTVRPALAVSFAWAVGVWWFGEGFGGIFTGHANALMGAPGAVVLYALIGLLVWPRAGEALDGPASHSGFSNSPTGVASSAAGRGPLGPFGGLWVWASLWVFFAVLQFLPQNRVSGWLRDSLTGMASGQPGWYAHFLDSLGHAFTGAGTPIAVLLAAGFLVVGLGPVVTRRADIFIGAGMAFGVLFWFTGQALGGILTGMATDPNAGLLLVLLGAAFLPTVLDPVGTAAPVATAIAGHQRWATLGVIALAIVPAAVAVVPGAPAAAASGSSSGMSSMNMSASGVSPSTAGRATSGTPKSMNMAAMAGLGVTNPDWKYTGPSLTTGETSLLTTVSNATDRGHAMQTPTCSTPPTSTQVLGAMQYVQATSAAVAKYKNLSVAVAAGYIPVTTTAYPVVHYVNLKYMNRQDILNPRHVDSLVYAFTPRGPVLVAAMYLMPGLGNGPMPYGCLVQWHAHTNLCTSTTTHQIDGFTPCPPGSRHKGRTPYMTHVWQVPVAGGPLAIDPSDLQVVQAAIMAQQEGLAPVSTSTSPSVA